jgi:hypothetical protein
MIRSKIFTFFTVALIGGFVLTTSSDVLAAMDNEEAKRNVTNWASQYGITSKDGKSVEDTQKEFEEALKKVKKDYQDAYIKLTGDCYQTWVNNTAKAIDDKASGCLSNLWDNLTDLNLEVIVQYKTVDSLK